MQHDPESLRTKIKFLQELRVQEKQILEDKYSYNIDRVQREIEYEVFKAQETFQQIKDNMQLLHDIYNQPKKQKTTYKKLQKELANSQFDMTQMKKQLRILTSQLQTKTISNNQKVEKRMRLLEQQTKSSEEKHRKERAKLENEMRDNSDALHMQLSAVESENERLKCENDSLINTINTLESCQEKLMREQDIQAEKKLEIQHKGYIMDLEKVKREKLQIAENFREEIEIIKRQTKSNEENYETKIASYIQQIADLEGTLKKQISSIHKLKKTHADELLKKEANMEKHRKQIEAQINKKLEVKDEELDSLKNKMMIERAKAQSKLLESTQLVSHVRKEKERADASNCRKIQDMKIQISDLKKQYSKGSKRLNALKRKTLEENRALEGRIKKLQERQEDIEKDSAEMQASRDAAQNEVKQLKLELAKKVEELEFQKVEVKKFKDLLDSKEETILANEVIILEQKNEIEKLNEKCVQMVENNSKKKKIKKSKKHQYSTFPKPKKALEPSRNKLKTKSPPKTRAVKTIKKIKEK